VLTERQCQQGRQGAAYRTRLAPRGRVRILMKSAGKSDSNLPPTLIQTWPLVPIQIGQFGPTSTWQAPDTMSETGQNQAVGIKAQSPSQSRHLSAMCVGGKMSERPYLGIDHVVIRSATAEPLYDLLHKRLGLPVIWPLQVTPFATYGWIGIGNTNLEIWAAVDNSDLPADCQFPMFNQIALAPTRLHETGACQGSCRPIHARRGALSSADAGVSIGFESRSGLSLTTAM